MNRSAHRRSADGEATPCSSATVVFPLPPPGVCLYISGVFFDRGRWCRHRFLLRLESVVIVLTPQIQIKHLQRHAPGREDAAVRTVVHWSSKVPLTQWEGESR